jgi:Glycosyltransferase family 87
VRARLAAAGALAGAWALTLWVMSWSDERVNDLFVYRSYAGAFLDGVLPYRDVAFEYPPLAAPVIGLPGLGGTGADGYRWTFALVTLAFFVAVALLVRELALRSRGSGALALAGVAVAPLLAGAMMRTHFDLVPVALVLGALLLVVRVRPVLGLALLGVATMTKGFPLVVAPVVLAWLVARGERRAALRGGCACAAVVALLAGVSVALSPSGSLDALRYQTERPVQVESLPSYGIRAIEHLGGAHATPVSSYKSDGLEHPAGDALAALSALIGLAFVALFAVGAARPPADERAVILASLGAIAAFATFGKVLSPQYLIWVLPLGALALAYRMWVLAAAVALATLLTFGEFPSRYFDLVDGRATAVAIVALRDATLVVVVALAARALLRPAGRPRAPLPAPG